VKPGARPEQAGAPGGERNGETRTSVCPGFWYLGRSRIDFHERASTPFEAVVHAINAGEEPYVPRGTPRIMMGPSLSKNTRTLTPVSRFWVTVVCSCCRRPCWITCGSSFCARSVSLSRTKLLLLSLRAMRRSAGSFMDTAVTWRHGPSSNGPSRRCHSTGLNKLISAEMTLPTTRQSRAGRFISLRSTLENILNRYSLMNFSRRSTGGKARRRRFRQSSASPVRTLALPSKTSSLSVPLLRPKGPGRRLWPNTIGVRMDSPAGETPG
jgi:hypothetical protein